MLVASLSLLYILKLIFFRLLLFSFLLISFQNFDFTKIIADDLKRNSDEENQSTTIRQLESRLSDTLIALKSTEARYKLTSQESKRLSDANDRLSRNLNVSKNEMETLRKQYDETRRNLLHLQRCARNAQTESVLCVHSRPPHDQSTAASGTMDRSLICFRRRAVL